jgi:hypothetical protein
MSEQAERSRPQGQPPALTPYLSVGNAAAASEFCVRATRAPAAA